MPYPYKMISRYLDTVGDGSGTKNAIGDYSAAVTEFKIQPAASLRFRIARLLVSVVDANGMRDDEYGNLGNALANGIQIQVKDTDGNVINDLTDGIPITTNGGWSHVCYDTQVFNIGAGEDHLLVRWTFSKSGTFIALSDNYYFAAILNDDFDEAGTGLIGHYFMVQGYQRGKDW